MVEDIFALAVALEIAGQGAQQFTVRAFKRKVLRQPAGLCRR
jgi:hypothetical protein